MNRRRSCSVVVACVLAVAGCSGDDGGSGETTVASADRISVGELASFSDGECPLPVYEATGFVGSEPSTGSVDIAPPGTVDPAADPRDVAPLQVIDGVAVDCELTVEDGAEVQLLLVAGRTGPAGSAANLLAPALLHAAELTSDELQPIVATFPDLELGQPAGLPGDAPVALVRLSVQEAADAALLVWTADDLTRQYVEQVATEMYGLLR